MKVFVLGVISILLLSGCSTIDLIETQEESIDRTPLDISSAKELNLKDPNWIVVTPDNADDVFAYLKEEGYDPVIFGLTDQGYEELSIDFLKIRQHINTQRNILLRYKEYYEDTDTSPPASE